MCVPGIEPARVDDIPRAVAEARKRLDQHTREIVKWHFDPKTGCPFWLEYAKKLGWDPRKEIRSYDDLDKFPFFEDEWLRGGPVRVEGVGRTSTQGDVRFADALERMGARITMGDNWIEANAGEDAKRASQLQDAPRGVACRLHSRPAMALNQTSTDRSTCTTNATRKKSVTGSQRFSSGVRAATSRIENTPEPISAARPSQSQPRARARCAVSGCGRA